MKLCVQLFFTPCTSGTVPGPELPTQLWQHAMINIKNDLTIFIGGEENPYVLLNLTLYYNHTSGNWSYGPGLIQARREHAVGTVIDEFTKEELVLVTGGIYEFSLKSTEILLAGKWSRGNL